MLIHTLTTKTQFKEVYGAIPMRLECSSDSACREIMLLKELFFSPKLQRGMGQEGGNKEAHFKPPVTSKVGELSLSGITGNIWSR